MMFCFPASALCRTLACMMGKETSLALLRQMLAPAVQFCDGQWEAIDLAANQRPRLLVVQARLLGRERQAFPGFSPRRRGMARIMKSPGRVRISSLPPSSGVSLRLAGSK
jgi:hypothetical protein